MESDLAVEGRRLGARTDAHPEALKGLMRNLPRFWVLGAALLVAAGCAKNEPEATPSPPKTLSAGTPVELILLDTLDSGGSDDGSRVALMVAEDVRIGGEVVVRRGAPAEAVVAYSRAAGTLSALANTPARLSIRLERTWGVDGTEVSLAAGDDPEEPYAFTRDNTGRKGRAATLPEGTEAEEAKKLLEAVAANLEQGKSVDMRDEATAAALSQAAEQWGMGATGRLIRDGEISKASSLLDQVRQGGSAAALVNGAALPTVAAALELAQWAGDVGSRMSRMLKGRNIKAHIGTHVPARVAKETQVQGEKSEETGERS